MRFSAFTSHLTHVFNIRRAVGIPLHTVVDMKGGSKVGGGAGDKAQAGFDLRSAEAHM